MMRAVRRVPESFKVIQLPNNYWFVETSSGYKDVYTDEQFHRDFEIRQSPEEYWEAMGVDPTSNPMYEVLDKALKGMGFFA